MEGHRDTRRHKDTQTHVPTYRPSDLKEMYKLQRPTKIKFSESRFLIAQNIQISKRCNFLFYAE